MPKQVRHDTHVVILLDPRHPEARKAGREDPVLKDQRKTLLRDFWMVASRQVAPHHDDMGRFLKPFPLRPSYNKTAPLHPNSQVECLLHPIRA